MDKKKQGRAKKEKVSVFKMVNRSFGRPCPFDKKPCPMTEEGCISWGSWREYSPTIEIVGCTHFRISYELIKKECEKP